MRRNSINNLDWICIDTIDPRVTLQRFHIAKSLPDCTVALESTTKSNLPDVVAPANSTFCFRVCQLIPCRTWWRVTCIHMMNTLDMNLDMDLCITAWSIILIICYRNGEGSCEMLRHVQAPAASSSPVHQSHLSLQHVCKNGQKQA